MAESPSSTVQRVAPGRDCPRCPRLVAYREAQRALHPDWHNAPVPSFGNADARLVVVGLAPGVSGANRTGRPFTGDHAGIVLYPTLAQHGLANDRFAADPADGLELHDTRITNAVRCVPPANKPLPVEISTCGVFLQEELSSGTLPRVILALGRIAHDASLRALGLRIAAHPFAHGAVHRPAGKPIIVDTYHTSRYNMNTGRLTTAMFDEIIATVRRTLAEAA